MPLPKSANLHLAFQTQARTDTDHNSLQSFNKLPCNIFQNFCSRFLGCSLRTLHFSLLLKSYCCTAGCVNKQIQLLAKCKAIPHQLARRISYAKEADDATHTCRSFIYRLPDKCISTPAQQGTHIKPLLREPLAVSS